MDAEGSAECSVLTEADVRIGGEPTDSIEVLQIHEQQIEARRLRLIAELPPTGVFEGPKGQHVDLWLSRTSGKSRQACRDDIRDASVMFIDLPELGDAFTDGRINRQRSSRIARLWATAKYRTHLRRDIADLVELAQPMDWPDFNRFIAAWIHAVDDVEDTIFRDYPMEQRGLRVTRLGDGMVKVELRTTETYWAQIQEALQPRLDAMFEQDCAVAREAQQAAEALATPLRLVTPDESETSAPVPTADGDAGGAGRSDEGTPSYQPAYLPRSFSQRSHDALLAAFRAGANHVDPGVKPVVSLVVDANRFADVIERYLGIASQVDADPHRPDQLVEQALAGHCHNKFGAPISSRDAVLYAIAGQIRLFLINAKTRDVNVSRPTRLFTGPLRDAVMILDSFCATPGCGVPSAQCDIDHIMPFSHGGPTTTHNAQPLCRSCHTQKTRSQNIRGAQAA